MAGNKIYDVLLQRCRFVGKRYVCWGRSWRRSMRLTSRRRLLSCPNKKSWRWWQPEKDGRGRWKICWNRYNTLLSSCCYYTGCSSLWKQFCGANLLLLVWPVCANSKRSSEPLKIALFSLCLKLPQAISSPHCFSFWIWLKKVISAAFL